jgi:hypothetical protein
MDQHQRFALPVDLVIEVDGDSHQRSRCSPVAQVLLTMIEEIVDAVQESSAAS